MGFRCVSIRPPAGLLVCGDNTLSQSCLKDKLDAAEEVELAAAVEVELAAEEEVELAAAEEVELAAAEEVELAAAEEVGLAEVGLAVAAADVKGPVTGFVSRVTTSYVLVGVLGGVFIFGADVVFVVCTVTMPGGLLPLSRVARSTPAVVA